MGEKNYQNLASFWGFIDELDRGIEGKKVPKHINADYSISPVYREGELLCRIRSLEGSAVDCVPGYCSHGSAMSPTENIFPGSLNPTVFH